MMNSGSLCFNYPDNSSVTTLIHDNSSSLLNISLVTPKLEKCELPEIKSAALKTPPKCESPETPVLNPPFAECESTESTTLRTPPAKVKRERHVKSAETKSPVSENSSSFMSINSNSESWKPSSSDISDPEELCTPPTKVRRAKRCVRPNSVKPYNFYSDRQTNNTEKMGSSQSSQDSMKSDSEEDFVPYKYMTKKTVINKPLKKHNKLWGDDSEEDESKMSEFELQRKRNIEAQKEFLKSINMDETKKKFESCFASKKSSKPRNQTPKASLPPREKSERLQQKTGIKKRETALECRVGNSRDFTECFQMCNIMYKTFSLKDFNDYFVRLYSKIYGPEEKIEIDLKTCHIEEFENKISLLNLKNEQIVKVLPDTISSIAIHPSTSVMLLAAGGKSGSVGFWNVNKETGDWDDSNVIVFLPHVNIVSAVSFSNFDHNSVYTCSWDGTLRYGDLTAQVFQLLYTDNSARALSLHGVAEVNKNVSFVARHGGVLVHVDKRINYHNQKIYRIHKDTLRSVCLNPKNDTHLLTTSEDKFMALWDVRMLSTRKINGQIWSLNTSYTVNAASISHSGNRILANIGSELICIYEMQGGSSPFKSWEVRRPTKCGKPSSTAFNCKAAWHPQREDQFCVANPQEGVDVYRCNYTLDPLHSQREVTHLNTQRCALAVFHPTLPALVASCNSSLHLFL